MGDKKEKKRTTKKTSWENIRSWAGAVLCVAVIVVIASYIAKLIPGSSAWSPVPTSVDLMSPTPWSTIQPTNLVFGDPIQLTGNLNDPWEDEYNFSETGEFFQDISEDYIIFSADSSHAMQPIRSRLFLYKISEKTLEEIMLPGDGVIPFSPRQGASIWGDNVVFCFNYNIYRYNIITKEITEITNDVIAEGNSRPNQYPDIYRNLIVWSRKSALASRYRVMLYDINNNQQLGAINPNVSNSDQLMPLIFNNNVVWLEHVNIDGQTCDILVWYDMKNMNRTIVETAKYDISGHDIYDDQIIWRGTDSVLYNTKTYIKEFDISTTTYKVIDEAWGMYPFIVGTPRVWKGLLIYSQYGFITSLGQILTMIDTRNQEFRSFDLSKFGKGSSYAEIGIDGSEAAFIYPGPLYEFNVAFDGDHVKPQSGSVDEYNIYLINGKAY